MLRMMDERMSKKALEGYRESWIDATDKDVKSVLKCKNWRSSAEDRDAWRWRIEEVKAQIGL